ncbi:MAG: hypothetical protein M3264_08520 [Thermoproteota archaeon]|nr:hypothetical protein [Thermoproteota archaeon]
MRILFQYQQLHTNTEQVYKQANEIANNPLKAADINNKLAINAVDVARDNLKILQTNS